MLLGGCWNYTLCVPPSEGLTVTKVIAQTLRVEQGERSRLRRPLSEIVTVDGVGGVLR